MPRRRARDVAVPEERPRVLPAGPLRSESSEGRTPVRPRGPFASDTSTMHPSAEAGPSRRSPSGTRPSRSEEPRETTSAHTPSANRTPPASPRRALEQALDKIDAWMRREPASQAARARASAEPTPAPAPPAARLRRDVSPGPSLAPRERASLGTPASHERAPRLTIGNIEVRVVPPAPAPVVQPRTAPAGAASAARPAPRLSAHLTFGLRQR